jgi:hypothetical protein
LPPKIAVSVVNEVSGAGTTFSETDLETPLYVAVIVTETAASTGFVENE